VDRLNRSTIKRDLEAAIAGVDDAPREPMLDADAVASLATAIRDRSEISDVQFDRVFPPAQRFRSHHHWTPIEVAVRACCLLNTQPGESVLDVGSGVGKLCLIGALTTPARWIGVERVGDMVIAATEAAWRLRVTHQVDFVVGDAMDVDWSPFDAIYMFNPFAERLVIGSGDALTRRHHFTGEVERARMQLSGLRSGVRLVTYYGFGGELPEGFELMHCEVAREDRLCVWMRS
jgi:protein-L-isoaspartate O-methyltransferase